jgi:hypothetical protein
VLTTRQNNKIINGIRPQADLNSPLQTHKILTKEMLFKERSYFLILSGKGIAYSSTVKTVLETDNIKTFTRWKL